MQQAAHLLPNSKLEYDQLAEFETPLPPYTLVPNGIDPGLFVWNGTQPKDSLKIFSNLYFHGHSVGGTNPSLLEAMASRTLIAAHDNPFNRAVLQQDAFYFSSLYEITEIIENTHRNGSEMVMINNNLQKIQEQFNWHNVIKKYEDFIQRCVLEKMSRSLESSKL